MKEKKKKKKKKKKQINNTDNDALTAAIKAERTLPGPAPRCVIEDVGSSASASTKTSSLCTVHIFHIKDNPNHHHHFL